MAIFRQQSLNPDLQPLLYCALIRTAMKRLWFLGLALGLATASQTQTNPTVVVVSGGTLVDVASGTEIPDTTIVIRGQRIERVDRASNTKVPAGAQVVDVRGKWIVPGLIDSHAHAGDDASLPLSLYLAGQIQREQRVRTNARALQQVFSPMARSRVALETGTHSPWISRLGGRTCQTQTISAAISRP